MAGNKRLATGEAVGGGLDKQEAAPASRRTVARLTFLERTKLAQALEARRDDLLRDRPHPADAAAVMSEVLGFPVTPQHVRTGMADSGVSWVPGRRKGTWPVSRVGKLREEVKEAVWLLGVCGRDGVPDADLAGLGEAGRSFCDIVRRLHEGGEE